MTAAVTPLAAVALTVLVVDFRHVFYAFSFPLHLVRHPPAKAYAVYAMIDEAYAVNASLPDRERSAPRLPALRPPARPVGSAAAWWASPVSTRPSAAAPS
ncbi:AzlC family ABC transporter permease [Streptomyces chiangmaiensis]|uniref:AzlC family ABC transporter permease n=1 Tax=Streptomyces chiangmaiensis TaxID=766497 RepID=A0ABU7FCQ2_9ACTN|nr:AzlC family ABC transporter permease [Streptomyces chiangmaiensis]MED7821833.1 AzlC family ABC transporter permease [Streptomyces chiangmaiensis]